MTRLAKRIFFLGIVLHLFLLQSFLPILTLPNQNTVVECIMVESSGCSNCHNTYLTMIKPFYDEYRNNDSVNFTLIDIFTPEGNNLFTQQITRLNINPGDHSSLPWVIFVWNDTHNIEILDETELETIEATFLSILDFLKNNISTTTGTPSIISSSETDPLTSSIDIFPWLIPSIGVITLIGIFIGGSGYLIYKFILKPKP